MVLEFNKNVTSVVSSLYKIEGTACLASKAANRVGCDVKLIQGKVATFLRGLSNDVILSDTNHNDKNFRYQGIRGSCPAIMGDFTLDQALFYLAGVVCEL